MKSCRHLGIELGDLVAEGVPAWPLLSSEHIGAPRVRHDAVAEVVEFVRLAAVLARDSVEDGRWSERLLRVPQRCHDDDFTGGADALPRAHANFAAPRRLAPHEIGLVLKAPSPGGFKGTVEAWCCRPCQQQ